MNYNSKARLLRQLCLIVVYPTPNLNPIAPPLSFHITLFFMLHQELPVLRKGQESTPAIVVSHSDESKVAKTVDSVGAQERGVPC